MNPPDDENLRYGRYNVLRREDGTPWELGRGGMGVTYKAEDPELRRTVVLKVIRADLLGNDPQARARFRREARSAAGVHHSNIATVFDIGEARGEDYYVMEHIAGEDLLTKLKRDGPLDVLTTLQIGRQVAAALFASWELSIVHRDLKPANLMLLPRRGGPARETRKGPKVKVVDFGLAKAIKAAGEVADAGGHATGMSGTLRPVFTAAYASPEQIDGADDLDIRSDLYSLGVTLWHCLVGHPTFGNTSQQKAVVGHLSKEPPFGELHAAGVPTPLIALFVRLLAKDPADRPATPAALLDVLEGLLNGETPAPTPIALPSTPEPPAPRPIPVAADHSFTLAEVLRQRGVLPPAEAWTLLEALAPLVDDAWNNGPGGEVTAASTAAAGGDLDPARIRVRLAEPPLTPSSLRELPGRPVGKWPACTLELDAAEERYPLGFGHTRPGPRGRAALSPAGALAALGCELIGGQPPAPGPWRPLPALDEAGNDLLREALRAETRFRSAGEFVRALCIPVGPSVVENVAMPPPARPYAVPSPVVATPLPTTPAVVGRAPRRSFAAIVGRVLLAFVSVGVLLFTLFLFVAWLGGNLSSRLAPKDAADYTNQGNSHLLDRQYELAVSDYTKAIEVDPKFVKAYWGRSVVYNVLKQFDRSIEDCGKQIELNPNDSPAYNFRGLNYSQIYEFDRAIVDFSKAIELNPKYAFAYNCRGNAYNELKRYELAIVDLNKAIELDPDHAARAYSDRGSVYVNLKQYELALTDSNKAIELSPTYADSYSNRGNAYRALGKTVEAERDFAKAKELSDRQTR